MTFPDALKALRLAAGLTQAHLAEKAGVSQHGISQYERGERTPPAEIVSRLSNALGLPTFEGLALLAVAGYSSDQHRELASQDLETYLAESSSPEHATQN